MKRFLIGVATAAMGVVGFTISDSVMLDIFSILALFGGAGYAASDELHADENID